MRRTARGLVVRLTLTALALTTAACASMRQSAPVRVSPQTSEGEWRAVLAEHTRRHEPYDWLMRQADLRATLVTPRLRHAFLTHREQFHGRFAQQAQQELIAMGTADEGVDAAMTPGPAGEEQIVVFVAMYVADQKNRDLAASYSIWDAELVRGDARVKPIVIETVRPSPAVTALFPYIDRFDDLYVMRFPLADAAGKPFLTAGGAPLALEVKSALAEAHVEWVLSE